MEVLLHFCQKSIIWFEWFYLYTLFHLSMFFILPTLHCIDNFSIMKSLKDSVNLLFFFPNLFCPLSFNSFYTKFWIRLLISTKVWWAFDKYWSIDLRRNYVNNIMSSNQWRQCISLLVYCSFGVSNPSFCFSPIVKYIERKLDLYTHLCPVTFMTSAIIN